ncbi:hypothetical protein EQG68_07350 [Flavobacterium piscinae]|uniref:Lipoprotein n=2 Tax=Flavobacterium piscinae TaxID=2506424 RepID=A0A4V1N4M0_9FLAO|nr:hypothetical protein [Flavobacterium piscinae]RXR32636.1 hypothetical protein EQG68_07350 [Flavobacterium piscinae]
MTKLFIIFISFFLLGCSNKKNNYKVPTEAVANNRNFGEELYQNDFLIYSDSQKLDSLKHNLINKFDIYNEDIYRLIHVDAEELAEFSFDFFLPNLNKVLKKRSFEISIRKSDQIEFNNTIFINEEEIMLYSQYDIENYTFWDVAPRRFFSKINELLKKHNSNEKFFLLYEGNDLHVILLTENQFKIICEKYEYNKSEIPYLP